MTLVKFTAYSCAEMVGAERRQLRPRIKVYIGNNFGVGSPSTRARD